jgi:hypothetical protein
MKSKVIKLLDNLINKLDDMGTELFFQDDFNGEDVYNQIYNIRYSLMETDEPEDKSLDVDTEFDHE